MPVPDHNFFSISGDDAGSIWVNDRLLFTAADAGMREIHIESVWPDKNTLWNDALKLSGLRRVRIFADVVDGRGCLEDAVDINHCEDVELFISILYPGTRYCATIKGESKRIKIKVGVQIGHGGETDFDYGNDGGHKNGYTTGQSLDVLTEDRSHVRVRCLQADPISLENFAALYRYDFPSPRAWYHRIAVNFLTLFFQFK